MISRDKEQNKDNKLPMLSATRRSSGDVCEPSKAAIWFWRTFIEGKTACRDPKMLFIRSITAAPPQQHPAVIKSLKARDISRLKYHWWVTGRCSQSSRCTENRTKEEAELAQLLDFILPNDVLFKRKTVTRASRATLDHSLTRVSWTQHAILKKMTTLVNFLYQSVFSFIHRSLFLYSLKPNEVKLPRWTFLIVENVTGYVSWKVLPDDE